MSEETRPEVGLVVILPKRPALGGRNDTRVHDLLLELADRHPGDQDMFVVFDTGERIAFSNRSMARRTSTPTPARRSDRSACTSSAGRR